MPVFRLICLVLLAAGLAVSSVPAAESPEMADDGTAAAAAASQAEAAAHPQQNSPHHSACLTKSEQRAAVASKSAMSLGDAIKSLRAHGRRAEVVRARLCRRDERLVYVLTLLGRSGRVREVNVDAVSGDLIVGR